MAATDTVDLPPRILNITVPQVGHLPLMALRPFFMVSSTASMISFFALHLTQYPSGIKNWLPDTSCVTAVTKKSLWAGYPYRQLVKAASKLRAAGFSSLDKFISVLIQVIYINKPEQIRVPGLPLPTRCLAWFSSLIGGLEPHCHSCPRRRSLVLVSAIPPRLAVIA